MEQQGAIHDYIRIKSVEQQGTIQDYIAAENHKGLYKNKICRDISELSSFVGNPVSGEWSSFFLLYPFSVTTR